jgi:hypothetical protein
VSDEKVTKVEIKSIPYNSLYSFSQLTDKSQQKMADFEVVLANTYYYGLMVTEKRKCSPTTRPSKKIILPGVNFINVLQATFTNEDLKSTKRQSRCQSFWHFWDLCAQKLLVVC